MTSHQTKWIAKRYARHHSTAIPPQAWGAALCDRFRNAAHEATPSVALLYFSLLLYLLLFKLCLQRSQPSGVRLRLRNTWDPKRLRDLVMRTLHPGQQASWILIRTNQARS